jgi:hypothetical protein
MYVDLFFNQISILARVFLEFHASFSVLFIDLIYIILNKIQLNNRCN